MAVEWENHGYVKDMLNLNIIIFNENIFTNSIGMLGQSDIQNAFNLAAMSYACRCASVCVAVWSFQHRIDQKNEVNR